MAKIALSPALIKTKADILILDEPTSAIAPQAAFDIFNHFRTCTHE